jgi:hypothetical protein
MQVNTGWPEVVSYQVRLRAGRYLVSKVRNHNYKLYLCKAFETEAKTDGNKGLNKGGSRQKCQGVEKCDDGVCSVHGACLDFLGLGGLELHVSMHLVTINQDESVKFRGKVRGLEKRK